MSYVFLLSNAFSYCLNLGPYTSGVPYRADSVHLCFRTLTSQRLWVMVLPFRATGRFGAEVLMNIVQAGLVDVAL